MAEKFELGSYLKGIVPESGTFDEQIDYIDIGLIDGDENNFYELSDVAALAANIETVGLQQPLRVRTSETDPLRVKIISGHRRKAALDKLVQDGSEKFRRVPVIREQVSGSAALQKLKLIFANSDTRKISSADLAKQTKEVEDCLVQLREEGFAFPGRMRDHVAEVCKVSKTRLANLKVIREKLIEDAKKAWEKGDIAEDAALKLARLPEEVQKRIVASNKKRNNGQVRWLYAGTIEAQATRYEEVEKIQCQLYGCECTNRDNKKAYLESQGDRYYGSCHRSCCSGCDRLTSCEFVCPLLSSEVRAAKEQKRQENAQAKLEKEARERPQRDLQEMLWSRFAQARKDAGVSLDTLFKAWNVQYPSTYIKDFEKHERGEGLRLNVSVETPLNPYGGYLSHAKSLITLADTLDVSLDYLLGRADEPNPEQVKMEVADAPQLPRIRWESRGVTPPEGKLLILSQPTNACDKLTPAVWNGHVFHAPGNPDKELTGVVFTRWLHVPESRSTEAFELEPSFICGIDLAESKPTWRTDAPPEGAVVLGKFQADGGKILHKTVCYRDGKYYFNRNSSLDVALPCAGWILLPED